MRSPKIGVYRIAAVRYARAVGLAVLNAERVLDYADHWRSLARGWVHLAGKEVSPRAAKLRHAAQMALYAAYEAEQLLKACRAVPSEAHEQATAVAALLIPEPVEPPFRHGPLTHFGPMGPVLLAGQRPRSGPYSGRRAARFG